MNQDSPEQGASGEKKASPFEGMSREDLVRKCKFLLSLIQKTKQSKEELAEENKNLKEDINNYESQKSADKKCLKAMQEVVESLTENKLSAAIKISELEGAMKTLEGKMKEFSGENEGLSIENEALKRQINRLTDENDSLAADVTSMDVKLKEVSKIGVEQQNLLHQLREATSDREKDSEMLEETRAKLSQVSEENSKLLEDLKTLEKEKEKSTAKMKLYRGKIVEMSSKVKQLKQSYKIVVEIVKDYSVTIPGWQSEMQKVAGKMQHFIQERDKEMEKFSARIKELEESQNQDDQSKLVEECREKIQELELKLRELEESLKDSEFQRQNITEKLNAKDEECEKLAESLESQSNSIIENQMREMQRFQDEVTKLSEHSRALECQLSEKEEQNTQFNALRENHEKQVDVLQQKINELEDKLSQENQNQQEIEDLSKSFEEKLRSILEKHQTEIESLQTEIERLEGKTSNLEIRVQEKDQELKVHRLENADLLKEMKEINEVLKERGEAISNLQVSNEKLCLQLSETEQRIEEAQKRPISSPDPHLEDSTESGENFEEKYTKLRVLAQKLKKKVSDQNAQITTLETEVKNLRKENDKLKETVEKLDSSATEAADLKSLKKEKEAFLITQRQLQKEIDEMRKSLAETKNQHKEAVQREQNMKSELEKSKAVAKKSNVLSLEIDAYEKSLNEVSQKLDAKKHQVQDLEASLESQRESIKVLNDQIRVLEESLKSEQVHSTELKKQVDSQQKKLRESDHDKTELRVKLDQAAKEMENRRQDLEEVQGQLSEKGKENEKVGSLLQAERDKFVRQVFNLEEEVTKLRNEMADKAKELEETLAEFSSYKVRAQAVLMKRHETKDTSRERELEEEVSALQSTVESLNQRHGALKQQHDELDRMVKVFQDDKMRSQTRLKELTTQLEDTRLTNETLIEANKKQLQDHQEALKVQRQHIDTLNACFKIQMDDLQEKHSKELANVRAQSETVAEAANIPDVRKEERARFPFDLATTDEQKMDMMLMEREDGEGSENTSQSSNVATRKISRGRRDLIPLDELLNSPFDDHEGAAGGSASPSAELQATQEKLLASENHIKHLTALLAEAEQDLAKLSQLNEMLKEEVRRQQRSLEREEHMHNSEYLKNVVFKFLTLSSGDEKAHLVPVLNTILKLSPEETQKLQSVARGGEGLGWGSFLPIWSNHQ